MPRTKVRDYRRSELIDAAIMSIAEHGLSDTTLATIAQQAGVSPGLVNHYFDGKEELLEAAFRRLLSDKASEMRRLLPSNPTPMQKLDAYIDVNLQKKQLRPGSALAWRAFWAHIPGHPKLGVIQRMINRRFRSNLLYSLRQLLPANEAEEVYLGLYALVDGFWFRQFIDPESFTMDDARKVCRRYLRRAIDASRTQDASETAATELVH
ncbi:transcriptional regulator BetI [Ensifer sp. BR816]|uniref:transcriptional regulator BetI n=1 Tax=Rhizobium sp. (strain BR816) TaxID=1057002 RepID=UPI0003621D16|nr:transcriptional regulator BetI [Ensifer sp. BR816]